MKANKLLAIAAFASVICLATACGSTENSTASVAVNESKETEIQGEEGSADKMQAGWLGSFDERVEYVRNGYPIWLPEITYADAYENFYANPKWRAFDSTE